MQARQAMAATSSTKVKLQATMALERMLAMEQQQQQQSLSTISQTSRKEVRANGAYDLSAVFEVTSMMDHPHHPLGFPSIEWSFDEGHHNFHCQQFLDSKIEALSLSTHSKRRKHHHHHPPDILVQLHPEYSDHKEQKRTSHSNSLVRSMNFASDLDCLPQGQLTTLLDAPASKHSIMVGHSSTRAHNGPTKPASSSTRTCDSLLQQLGRLPNSWDD